MSIPYAPEIVAEWLGWSPAEVVERFGAYVLVDVRLGQVELRPGPPTREQMRARVAAIIDAARP
jgi:hypothetical protein